MTDNQCSGVVVVRFIPPVRDWVVIRLGRWWRCVDTVVASESLMLGSLCDCCRFRGSLVLFAVVDAVVVRDGP